MESYEKKNRIAEALNLRNMKQVELAEKTGISKGTINNWLKQRYQPKQKSLFILARALDVSEMWLAGYDIPMERAPEQKRADELARLIQIIRNDDKKKELCMNIAQLSDSQLEIVNNMVNELLKVNSQLH